MKPQKIKDSKLQVVHPPTSQASNLLAAEYKDTFKEWLFQALAADGSYDGLESLVTKSLDDFDPQTGEAYYAHDIWVELSTMWVLLHREFPVQRSLCQASNFKEVHCCRA